MAIPVPSFYPTGAHEVTVRRSKNPVEDKSFGCQMVATTARCHHCKTEITRGNFRYYTNGPYEDLPGSWCKPACYFEALKKKLESTR